MKVEQQLTAGDRGNRSWARALEGAARVFDLCARDMDRSRRTIDEARRRPDTRASQARLDFRGQLEDLERTVRFCRGAAARLRRTAATVGVQVPSRKAWSDLLAYTRFLKDQCKAESDQAERVLRRLRSDGCRQQNAETSKDH